MKFYSLCAVWALLLAAAPEGAPPAPGLLSSASASYDGNALVLKGSVVLDHGLGKMEADEALLEKQETGKEFPFSMIHLLKGVVLSLKDHGSLSCGKADLDFGLLEGIASGETPVVYTHLIPQKKGEPTSLKITGMTTLLRFSKDETGPKPGYLIREMEARDAVEISYGTFVTLHAGRALYDANKVVTAYPAQEGGSCRIVRQGDQIEADTAQLNAREARLSLLHPRGVMTTSILPRDGVHAPLQFTAEKLLWDYQKQLLALKGDVLLVDPSLGTVSVDDELTLVQKGRAFTFLKTKGKTTITSQEGSTLLAFGSVQIDRDRKHALLESPLLEGSVPEEYQISYRDGGLLVHADKAKIDYAIQEGSLVPALITLTGHIHLLNKEGEETRLAIADRLTYSPGTRSLLLGADRGGHVIFMNEQENIRLAAQEIHITEDPTTNKQIVKGIGHVQLTLSSDEEEQLRACLKKS
jgi:lipopolysaccharide export system protein LptA